MPVEANLPENPERWTFDDEVADGFDEMLERSIPQYEVMRETVSRLAARHVRPHGVVVDLGCSRGEALARLREVAPFPARYVGLEVSAPMLAAARERFADAGDVRIHEHDLRQPLRLADQFGQSIDGAADVVLAILVAQFVPIEHRLRLLADAHRLLRPGGCIVLVEKVLGASAPIDALLVDEYLAGKRRNGYTDEQIARKRLSLEGVLVPVTARWNEDLLRSAGFAQIDGIWRWCNFAGWIGLKAE